MTSRHRLRGRNDPIGFRDQASVALYELLLELYALMEDETNEEIARILGLGRSTVKTHVSSILRRFDVDTRAAAVSRAMELTRFRPVIGPE